MPALSSTAAPNYTRKWLRLVGLFLLILALIFGVIALLIPVVRVGFIPAVGVLLATAGGLFELARRIGVKAAATQVVLATGLVGQATIVALRQTGLLVNFNPQVEITLSVEVSGRPPYQAVLKEIVPLIVLGRLSSATRTARCCSSTARRT